jgi:hypothetical protein
VIDEGGFGSRIVPRPEARIRHFRRREKIVWLKLQVEGVAGTEPAERSELNDHP